MFPRLFLMACPAVWSRETIKLSRLLPDAVIYLIYRQIYSQKENSQMFLRITRAAMSLEWLSFILMCTPRSNFRALHKRLLPFGSIIELFTIFFHVSDDIFIFISTFLFMKSCAKSFTMWVWLEMSFFKISVCCKRPSIKTFIFTIKSIQRLFKIMG